MEKIKLAIVDDHPMVLAGIKVLMRPFSNIQVKHTYADADALIEGLAKSVPDVLLLDLALPDKPGKELVTEVLRAHADLKILVLTSMDTPAMVSSLMRRGCKGYILKGADPARLVEAIETVYKGGVFVDAELKEQLLLDAITPKKPWEKAKEMGAELTEKEIEILKLIAAEYTTKEISEALNIGFRTAENYRYNLTKKLDVKNTAGLVKVAMQMGLVS